MKHLIATSFVLCGIALAPLAWAQDAPPVPVDKASYHVPAFRNELIAVTNVYIPPGQQAGYHIHSLDQLSVVVEDADQAGQELGGQPYAARRTPRGNVGYSAFSKKAVTHRVHNQGTTPPGLRIVVSGGEIVETVPGQPEQAMSPKLGEFFWKDAGTTRAIRNIGTSKIEFVEYELK